MVRPTRRATEEGSGLGPPLEVSWDTCLGVVLTPATIKDPTQAGGGAMAGVTDGVQDGEIAILVPGVQDGIVVLQEQHTPQEGVGVVPALAARVPGLLQGLEGRGGDRYYDFVQFNRTGASCELVQSIISLTMPFRHL